MTDLPTVVPGNGTPEERRRIALEAYDLLDEHHPSRSDIRSLVALAATASGVPMAVINLLTEDEQHQIETVGFAGATTARSDSMCAVVIDDHEPVVLADARQDPRFRDNIWVTGPASVRFYATFQLQTPAKVAFGTLCLFDTAPRELADEHRVLLSLLAARVTDVLELELQARRARAAAQDLARANARLVDFAATVSHDLRAPLATVQFALDMLEEVRDNHLLDEPDAAFNAHDLLARARRSTVRMASTISHLLGDPDSADPNELQAVLWRHVAIDAIEDLHHELSGLQLQVDETDALVRCRPVGLRLALQNILANAARYAGPVDPRVEVRWDRVGGHAEIAVIDHGPGVAAEDHDRIFASRERGTTPVSKDHHTADSDTSHGLGLATSRRLLVEMGGRLELRDTPGGGATFVLCLPDL